MNVANLDKSDAALLTNAQYSFLWTLLMIYLDSTV